MSEKVPPGTRVVYWGTALQSRFYGKEMTVLWANECGCAHQTYALQATDPEVRVLEQVLETSFRVVDSNES